MLCPFLPLDRWHWGGVMKRSLSVRDDRSEYMTVKVMESPELGGYIGGYISTELMSSIWDLYFMVHSTRRGLCTAL